MTTAAQRHRRRLLPLLTLAPLLVTGLTVGTSTAGTAAAPTAMTRTAVARAAGAPAPGTPLLTSRLFSQKLGPLSAAGFISGIGGTDRRQVTYEDESLVDTGAGHRAVRTFLDAGTIRTRPRGNNGIVAFVPLPRPVERACMAYSVRFDKDFDWSMGGKLPGLEGVAPGVAPGTPSGGHPAGPLGWSGRIMWRGPHAISTYGAPNMAVSYLYSPLQTDRYGDNLSWRASFVAGRWHRVKQCYGMNTVGSHDGVLRTWLDGRETMHRTDLVYRTRRDVTISHIAWSVFRGGNTMDWAGRHDDTIDIRRVAVTAY